jgi:hypothetical protein
VTVERSNGTTSTETLRGVMRKFDDAWVYFN